MVSPKEDLSGIQIDQCSDYITYGPPLPEVLMIQVPLFNSVAVEGVGVRAVANAIVVIEVRCAAAPSDLHEAVRKQGNLVVEAIAEHCSIRPNRDET